MAEVAEERSGHALIILLVVHQRDRGAVLERRQHLARAVRPLGRVEGDAISAAAHDDALVDVGVVRRPSGDDAVDPRGQDHGSHDLHVGEVARDEDAGRLLAAEGAKLLHADDLDPVAVIGQPVHDRHLGDVAAKILPLAVQDSRALIFAHFGKGEGEVSLGGAMGAGQRPHASQNRPAPCGGGVHRQGAQQGDQQVDARSFEPPLQALGPADFGLTHHLHTSARKGLSPRETTLPGGDQPARHVACPQFT